MIWLCIPVFILLLVFIICRSPLYVCLFCGGILLALLAMGVPWTVEATLIVFGLYLVFCALLLVPPIRKALITRSVFAAYKKVLPNMSETERVALEAGTVWWEGELFTGKPEWQKLLDYSVPVLRPDETSFLKVETEQLCRMVSDWDTTHVHHDLPPEVWQYIKEHGFLGMIIPKEYGGKGFSAYAHSQVVMKLASRCSAAAVTVMVPNSLGPAELLLHYGTEEQKQYYLPGLAKGDEIPAFALTSPQAGSDAASIPDYGVICRGTWEGREVVGMRVTWDKRYITLGPVCTVLGLAFRLYDPEFLIGTTEDLGITCALIPHNHPGVNIGRRHFPLNAVFQNGPNWGKDVFMPLDFIIGGKKMIGQGWRMLMECLAAGRSISLPASNTGMMKLAVRGVGAYARVRSQFKTPIGKFEGIEEPLARMGAQLYMVDAARIMTAGAIDAGERPSVVSAIIKYHATERGRQAINDGMDIVGGKGICLGPQNFLGRMYQQIPIGITVEGANILTRSLIIFGQGAIRCHPYVLKEMTAAKQEDKHSALDEFDKTLFDHIGFTISNKLRAFIFGLTNGAFISVPRKANPDTKRYYQHLTRMSSAFAFLSDITMAVLGGSLKRKEKISARLGDILALMYLCSSTLKRYEAEGCQKADASLMHWAMQDALYKIQTALEGLTDNFPNRFFGKLLKFTIFPRGRSFAPPSDHLGHEVAQLLIAPSSTRDRLVADSFVDYQNEEDPIAALELALEASIRAELIEGKIRALQKSGKLKARASDAVLSEARQANFISEEEYEILHTRDQLTARVIHVDDFPQDFGIGNPRAHIRPGS